MDKEQWRACSSFKGIVYASIYTACHLPEEHESQILAGDGQLNSFSLDISRPLLMDLRGKGGGGIWGPAQQRPNPPPPPTSEKKRNEIC